MSLYIEFDPHSWYMGFAIKDTATSFRRSANGGMETTGTIDAWRWHAYTDNGNTYRVDELKAYTLAELKRLIRGYRGKE